MAGGFYNHYDDPDEFWDEEPLRAAPKIPSPPTPAIPPAYPDAPPQRSAATAPSQSVPDSTAQSAPLSPAISEDVTRSTVSSSSGQTGDGTAELLAKTLRFQAYAQENQRLLNLATGSLPQQVTGTDKAGIITAMLGPRNDLLEIRVAEEWERRLDPSALGEAVVDASRNAERARAVANAEAAVDSGVLDRLKSMRVEDFAAAPIPVATDTVGPGRVLSLDQLTAAVFSLVDGSAKSDDENNDVVGVSEEAEGWVAVTLTRDGTMVGCTIGSHWAAGRGGSAITSALNEAAAAARRDRTAIATPTGKMSQADQVISDVIAFMANLNK